MPTHSRLRGGGLPLSTITIISAKVGSLRAAKEHVYHLSDCVSSGLDRVSLHIAVYGVMPHPSVLFALRWDLAHIHPSRRDGATRVFRDHDLLPADLLLSPEGRSHHFALLSWLLSRSSGALMLARLVALNQNFMPLIGRGTTSAGGGRTVCRCPLPIKEPAGAAQGMQAARHRHGCARSRARHGGAL